MQFTRRLASVDSVYNTLLAGTRREVTNIPLFMASPIHYAPNLCDWSVNLEQLNQLVRSLFHGRQ